MPYIAKEDRLRAAMSPTTAGELNFAITNLVINYIKTKTDSTPMNYALLNEIVGAMQSAKDEFCRRIVAPYEDKKIAENGDVYPFAPSALGSALRALSKPGIPPTGTRFGRRETLVVVTDWCFVKPTSRIPNLCMLLGTSGVEAINERITSVDAMTGEACSATNRRFQLEPWTPGQSHLDVPGSLLHGLAPASLDEIAAAPADNEASLRVFVPEPPIVVEPADHHNESAAGAEFPMRRDPYVGITDQNSAEREAAITRGDFDDAPSAEDYAHAEATDSPMAVCVEAPSAEDYPVAEPIAVEEDDRIPF